MTSAWYAVATLPRQEIRAETNLLRQGYHVWLPVTERTRRHARRTDIVREAFFPGYLFVSLDLTCDPWAPINGTYGVRHILCQCGRPAALPRSFVETLKDQADARGGSLATTGSDLHPGQKVRLQDGPFADYVGTLQRLDGRNRVTLLLTLLDREVTATVARDSVVAA